MAKVELEARPASAPRVRKDKNRAEMESAAPKQSSRKYDSVKLDVYTCIQAYATHTIDANARKKEKGKNRQVEAAKQETNSMIG